MTTYESWEYDEQDEAPRWLYLAGGSMLLWLGLRRWSIPAAIVTGAGALLLSRAMQPAEHGMIEESIAGEPRFERTARPAVRESAAAPRTSDDAPGNTVRDAAMHEDVDEASDESFPASDPPAWTPVTGPGH